MSNFFWHFSWFLRSTIVKAMNGKLLNFYQHRIWEILLELLSSVLSCNSTLYAYNFIFLAYSSTNLFHSEIFMPRDLISLQVQPMSAISSTTSHLHLFDGITLLLLPWRFQSGKFRVILSWGFLRAGSTPEPNMEIMLGSKTRRIIRKYLLINEVHFSVRSMFRNDIKRPI